MNNKLKYFAFIILIPILFLGCTINVDRLTFKGEKPNNYFYTNKLFKDFAISKSSSINVVYMNFYKGKQLSEDQILIVRKFFKYIHTDNFIEKPAELPEKPAYKMYFTFDKSKYVINVYNNRYLSIYPWDGDYEVDYIDMKNTYSAYNLFGICKYVTSLSK